MSYSSLFDEVKHAAPESGAAGADGTGTGADVDRLVEDPLPIASQKYVLLSFADPRPSTLEKKELFIMDRFLRWFYTQTLFHNVMSLVHGAVNDAANPLDETVQTQIKSAVEAQLQAAVLQERATTGSSDPFDLFDFSLKTFAERYTDYRALHQEDDTAAFQELLGTNELVTQGVKFRGAFGSLEEATERAQLLKRMRIEPYIDVFASEGFKWVPRNPHAAGMQVQYADDQGNAMTQLNELMREYQVQHDKRREQFEARRATQRAQAEAQHKGVRAPAPFTNVTILSNESESASASASASESASASSESNVNETSSEL